MGFFHRKAESDIDMLHKALQGKNEKAISKLIANGLTPQFALEEAFTLHTISPRVIGYLLKEGSTANVHVKLNDEHHHFTKATPLHIAAARNNTELIELLIAHGAGIDASCEDGTTPLMLAIKNNSVQAVKLLIKAGASIDIPYRNDQGEVIKPLQAAMTCGNKEIINELKKCKESSRPDVIAISWRIIALHRLATLASTTTRYLSQMSKNGTSDIDLPQAIDDKIGDIYYRLTNKEQQFVEKLRRLEVDGEILRTHIHDMESAATLLWVLSLINDIPAYDELTILPSSIKFPKEPNPKEFMNRAILREADSIKDELMRAMLWVWRSNIMNAMTENLPNNNFDELLQNGFKIAQTYDLIPDFDGKDLTAFGMPYQELSDDDWQLLDLIANKRLKALNWALGRNPDNCWDVAHSDHFAELDLEEFLNQEIE